MGSKRAEPRCIIDQGLEPGLAQTSLRMLTAMAKRLKRDRCRASSRRRNALSVPDRPPQHSHARLRRSTGMPPTSRRCEGPAQCHGTWRQTPGAPGCCVSCCTGMGPSLSAVGHGTCDAGLRACGPYLYPGCATCAPHRTGSLAGSRPSQRHPAAATAAAQRLQCLRSLACAEHNPVAWSKSQGLRREAGSAPGRRTPGQGLKRARWTTPGRGARIDRPHKWATLVPSMADLSDPGRP